MNYQIPDLTQFLSTKEEQDIAAQFTRYVPSSERANSDAPTAWLVVENQYFRLYPDSEDDRHAQWFCWMLAKALIRVQQKRDRSGGL